MALFDQLVSRLRDAGVDVQRASASLMTKHPDVFGKQLIWVRGRGARAVLRSHEVMASAMYQKSPVATVRRNKQSLRARLDGPAESLEYDLLRDLKADGATDYFIAPMPFRSGLHSFISWSTDRPGGFTATELELLDSIIPAVSLRWELESATYATETLLSTYLGDNAAKRVLDGEFKRRSGTPIEAVIWTADLRGFTTMVDERPIDDVLLALDEYFSCVAAPIAPHGGEVLKFIGDAVLAVFPIAGDGIGEVCARALASVRDALNRQREINRDRAERDDPPIRFGLALHVGEVVYGNIGVAGRLDFTVVGRAVNEACRVEAMTKELDTPVLLTGAFVDAAHCPDVVSIGEHAITGVKEPIRLYGLAD